MISKQQLLERFRAVAHRMEAACERSGRSPSAVQLVAVSKLHPPDLLRLAYATIGHTAFGESYAQELRDKSVALADLGAITWHAIGPLQRKNAKYVASAASYFHALDSPAVASALSRRRVGDPLRCFIEINLTGESTKAGVHPDALAGLIEEVSSLPGICVEGLTTMPPLTNNPEDSRGPFRALALLGRQFNLPHLSMGTSGDFEVAIEEGATMVRVGTELFGERSVDR